jgi:hypothetical protein
MLHIVRRNAATKTEVVVVVLPRANKSVQVLTAGLLAGGGDAPNRISDIIGNQKRSGLVDSESDRPSSRLSVEIGDDILGFAIGTPGAQANRPSCGAREGRFFDCFSLTDRDLPAHLLKNHCVKFVVTENGRNALATCRAWRSCDCS